MNKNIQLLFQYFIKNIIDTTAFQKRRARSQDGRMLKTIETTAIIQI
uniref:Uncharacterized protein n=1 Tax=Anguilla anguilla TaxID=7936 RepID=A0A0E9PYX9_ANGAN